MLSNVDGNNLKKVITAIARINVDDSKIVFTLIWDIYLKVYMKIINCFW